MYVVSVADGTEVEVADDVYGQLHDQAWSPDGRWLAYSKIGLDYVSNIYLYSLDDGTIHDVSSELFNDFGPVFTRDGRHLLFVSNRRFDPTFGDFEWEMVYKKAAGIYGVALTRAAAHAGSPSA